MSNVCERMSEFNELYRQFILRLIKSEDVALKILGCKELSKRRGLIELAKNLRPYPLAYIVSGCTNEELNGTYEIHRTLLTSDERLRNMAPEEIKYIKRADENTLEDKDIILERQYCYEGWMFRQGKKEIYCNRSYPTFQFSRPYSDCWHDGMLNHRGVSLNAEASGFILGERMESSPEHELV